MGFFSGLRNLMTRSGNVLGGDYLGYAVTLRIFKDKTRGMCLTALGKEIEIKKNDVKEFAIVGTNAMFEIGNNKCIGNRYKVVLNNGKSFIIGIVANDCSQFEATFMF